MQNKTKLNDLSKETTKQCQTASEPPKPLPHHRPRSVQLSIKNTDIAFTGKVLQKEETHAGQAHMNQGPAQGCMYAQQQLQQEQHQQVNGHKPRVCEVK